MSALSAESITVRRGDRDVLRDVSLVCAPGAVTGVLGPNGAGKSTLLLALLGALPTSEGEVMLGGRSLATVSAAERARQIAYVPQRTELTAPLTVRTVVAMGRMASRSTWAPWSRHHHDPVVDDAMNRTDIGGLADRRFDALSGGEQRRVLLARALTTEASVVLLDEPAASLDVGHALSLYRRLRELAADGYAVVAVLHDLDDALRFTDRALLLDRGAMVKEGPTASVIAADQVEAVYGVTLKEKAGLRFSLKDREVPI